jgi:hypothetical protein
MFGWRKRVFEGLAIDTMVRVSAVEVMLPYAMAGRLPDMTEVIEAVERHPDVKPDARQDVLRMAIRLLQEALIQNRHHAASSS